MRIDRIYHGRRANLVLHFYYGERNGERAIPPQAHGKHARKEAAVSFEPFAETVAMGLEALLPAYWICLIVGGGLLVISTIAGASAIADADVDFDVDVDADFDIDLDAHFDADFDADVDMPDGFDVHLEHIDDVAAGDPITAADSALSLSSWFSMRFVVFGSATFGFLGVVLSNMSELSPAATAVTSAVGGVCLGQAVHQLIRKIRRDSGNSTTMTSDYLKKPARVSIAIQPPAKGEVALRVKNAERFLPATARRDKSNFGVGEQVYVIAYHGGVAEVVSQKEYAFLTYTGRGGSA